MYGDPAIRSVENAVYVPFHQNGSWGLYDDNLDVVKDAIDYRGADRVPHYVTQWVDQKILEDTSRQKYIFVGRINPHFGHFIINSLPRLWPFFASEAADLPKILSSEPPALLPHFIRSVLEQLGIAIQDVAYFDTATRLSEVLVPVPCVLEQYWAYTVFKDLCGKIEANWYSRDDCDQDHVPAYLSKARISSGVGRFLEEKRVETILLGAGLDIFYPETLDLRAQVKLFARRRLCVGPAGSAFHTTIFGPKKRNIICYNPSDRVNSNFDLIDKLNDNCATYLYQDGMTYESNTGGFLTSVRLADPEKLAYDLLDVIESRSEWRRK